MISTRKYLRDEYGLRASEADHLVRIAKTGAVRIAESDVEEDRALMILRLERLIERSRDELDIRAEIAALKQLSIIQGLNYNDEANTMKDIIDVISRSAQDRIEAKTVEARVLPAADTTKE